MGNKRKIPIGQSDFKRIIQENFYYIDKSLLIKELLDDGSSTMLIPRPRRFGKTLNMSMLRHFFEKTDTDTSYLFKDLKIMKHKDCMNFQGKYPVIYITFKDIKDTFWEGCNRLLRRSISEEYERHLYLLEGNVLSNKEKEEFNLIVNLKGQDELYYVSIKLLSKFLCRYYNQRVIILIDEYDMPIHSGYSNGYYLEIISFMRSLLGGALKDNENLEKAVLTGILRVARESIFSGLNNLKVATLLKEDYSDRFGFTEKEVIEMLKYYEIEFEINDVRNWYNGYIFGKTVIYNPWSIINFADSWKEGLIPYWINTSGNDIVKELITKGDQVLKEELEILIRGGKIKKEINENIVLGDVDKDSNSVWSFLLFSGYLKSVDNSLDEGVLYCDLKIPNKEVNYLYKKIILSWFDENIKISKYQRMVDTLVNGRIEEFEDIFCDYIESVFSYHDVAKKEPEIVYHAFVLGMLVSLCDTHEIKSNRESGMGRYDVAVIPKDKSKIGIIFEFKKVNLRKKETIEMALKYAVTQIEEMNYKREIQDRGVKKIMGIAVAFLGKDVLMSYKYL